MIYLFKSRRVLEKHLSDGFNDMGYVKPSLALCVLCVFTMVYFSMWKGIKSSGKAVWITAIAPYIVLVILLVKGVSLPGASKGIEYYLKPQWDKLLETQVIHDKKLILKSLNVLVLFRGLDGQRRYGSMQHHRYSFLLVLVLVPYWHCLVTINSITIVTGMQ